MINGVIGKKLEVFDDTLKHLKAYLPVTFDQFQTDWGMQKIVERSLQILVEIMIDIANRIIAIKGDTPHQVSSDAIESLKTYGYIQDTSVYKKMIRFRNFLVHNYDTLDNGILYSIITQKLSDFEKYKNEILAIENL
ncbi:MAG: DUF86 domain-containing protein [Candidatus Magnetomorum sp.]|nr:DUF86 domain-containing protein [Candidatus Magnetomorum sp.]